MSLPLTVLYHRVLRTDHPDSPLADELLARIADYAETNGDGELLADVAGTASLRGPLRSRFAKHHLPDVVVEFVSRGDLTVGEADLVAKGERRVAVLVELAASPVSSPALLTRLAGHSHRRVAAHACANPRTPFEARLNAARRLFHEWNDLGRERSAITASLESDDHRPEFLRLLEEVATELDLHVSDSRPIDALAVRVVCAGVPEVDARRWIASRVPAWAKNRDFPRESLAKLFEADLDAETVELLVTAVRPLLAVWDRKKFLPRWLETAARLASAPNLAAHVATLDLACSSRDQTELSQLVVQVLSDDESSARDAIIEGLLGNEHLTVADRRSLIAVAPFDAIRRHLRRCEDFGSLVAALERFPGLLEHVVGASRRHCQALLAEAARIINDMPVSPLRNVVVGDLVKISAAGDLTVLRLLRWDDLLLNAPQWCDEVTATVTAAVTGLRDPDAVAAFATLAGEFSGTFGEMCDTVAAFDVAEGPA